MTRRSLDDLALFVRVVEERSFVRAARALGVPKSTLGRRIAALEEQVGAPLLHRTTRSLTPTALGAAHYDRCARIVAEAEQAARDLEASGDQPRGRLRIGAPVLFGTAFLGDAVLALIRAHPAVSVEVVLADRSFDVVREGLDLAIRVDRKLTDSSLKVRVLGEGRMMLVASAEYLARRGAPRRPADLERHDCVLLGGGSAARRWRLERAGRRLVVRVAGRTQTTSVALALDLALRGAGIANLPVFLCAGPIGLGRLRAVLDGWVPPPFGLYAVYPAARRPSPAVRAFIEILAVPTGPKMGQ